MTRLANTIEWRKYWTDIDVSPYDSCELIDFIKQINDYENLSFLDIGCGNGWLCYTLMATCSRVIGLDFIYRPTNIKGLFINGDMITLPFKNNVFNFISCLRTINYLSKIEMTCFLNEINRVANRYVALSFNDDNINSICNYIVTTLGSLGFVCIEDGTKESNSDCWLYIFERSSNA